MEYSFTLLAFYLVAIPAVIILGVGKGGFAGIGMVSLPIMALVVPPLQAASILLPILMLQDGLSAWFYRRTWDARNLKILLPGAVLGIIAGYFLAAKLPESVVALAVGATSAWFGLRQLMILYSPIPPASSSAKIIPGLVCGAFAALTSLIAHAGAPPFQIYVIPQRLSRDVFIGTSVIFFTFLNWMKLLPYFALGQLNAPNMLLSATLIPVAIASTWLGLFLVRRSSGRVFFIVIYCLMIAIGLYLIARNLHPLIAAVSG